MRVAKIARIVYLPLKLFSFWASDQFRQPNGELFAARGPAFRIQHSAPFTLRRRPFQRNSAIHNRAHLERNKSPTVKASTRVSARN